MTCQLRRLVKRQLNSIPSPVDPISCGVSPYPADFIYMRWGPRLVAGVGLFPTDLSRWYWGTYMGGTATPRIDGRTTKYSKYPKRKSL